MSLKTNNNANRYVPQKYFMGKSMSMQGKSQRSWSEEYKK